MAKFKRDILERIILNLEEESDLYTIKAKFEEESELTVTIDYVGKVVKSLERDGKIDTYKEIKKNYLKLKIIPRN